MTYRRQFPASQRPSACLPTMIAWANPVVEAILVPRDRVMFSLGWRKRHLSSFAHLERRHHPERHDAPGLGRAGLPLAPLCPGALQPPTQGRRASLAWRSGRLPSTANRPRPGVERSRCGLPRSVDGDPLRAVPRTGCVSGPTHSPRGLPIAPPGWLARIAALVPRRPAVRTSTVGSRRLAGRVHRSRPTNSWVCSRAASPKWGGRRGGAWRGGARARQRGFVAVPTPRGHLPGGGIFEPAGVQERSGGPARASIATHHSASQQPSIAREHPPWARAETDPR